MSEAAIKLTSYFSERDRSGDRFQADALFDVYERHMLRTSVLLRGAGGFGERHRMATDSLLTLSEDLPAVSVAVDTAERIERALPDVLAATQHGLVSLERARLWAGDGAAFEAADALKVTVYGGRGVRSVGAAGYVAAIDVLREAGVAGASVLLAVDGTLHGERRRAQFFARNGSVPLMLLAVGEGAAFARAMAEVCALVSDAVVTIERIQVCKMEGVTRAAPVAIAGSDASGLPVWQKLMIHASELATVDGHPLHRALVARLWEAGAAGVTVLRGVRGFYGGREVLADRVLSLRRDVPVHVVLVERPERVQQLWPLIDELTAGAGMVTSELVPAAGQRLWKNPALQAR